MLSEVLAVVAEKTGYGAEELDPEYELEADLGVTLVGHQKKMMNSIQALRAQLSVNMTEGFLV